jgi:hypothetical protein
MKNGQPSKTAATLDPQQNPEEQSQQSAVRRLIQGMESCF